MENAVGWRLNASNRKCVVPLLQLELGTVPEPISAVVSRLLELLSSQQPQHRLHWRYELMASAILMFLLPAVDAPTAKVPAIAHANGWPSIVYWP